MKDSSKLLTFNVNRDLKFKVFRNVNFNLDRDLAFNLNRNLIFDVNRDLGFGKRGVIFRGYVCPVCGAPVAKDASECDECGVKFEQTTTRKEKRKQKKKWDRGERHQTKPGRSTSASGSATKKAASKPSTSQQRRSTFQCPVCGKVLYVGAARCPGCDTVFSAGQTLPESDDRPGQERAAASETVFCETCGFSIPPTDKFCRRCGAPRPKNPASTTISWQEFQAKEDHGGLISYDEYSGKT